MSDLPQWSRTDRTGYDISTQFGASLSRGDLLMSVLRRFGNPYRLASYVLVLYAMGHTAGALISTPKFGTAADAVATSMKSVHFEAQGFETSWYGFYLGFGWFVSLFFILSATISWYIGGLTVGNRARLAAITWPLCLCYAGSVAIAWKYLFAAPLVFSSTATLLLAMGCVQDVLRRHVGDDHDARN
jgi:hypothetical protein